jgi:pimeloyl-ACP methyl ester carboxylesterase
MLVAHTEGEAMKRVIPIAFAAAALAAVAAVAGAGTAASKTQSTAKPTIVLVHGAWADGSSWSPVTKRLQDDGYTVDVPANPLRGLASDSASIAAFLSTISGPIVLVGHSYGGAVITNAALGNSQVKALVYVDAFIPAKGDTLIGLTEKPSCFAAPPPDVFNFVPIPGAPDGVADAYVKPNLFPGCFANGLSARKGAELAAAQRPLATNALSEPSGEPAYDSGIPAWDVIGTADHVITPKSQLAMAANAHAKVTEIDAPHLSMLAKPEAVTKVIEQAAAATS